MIEYMLVGLLCDWMDGVIDCLLFGCWIGFYLIIWGEYDIVEVVKVLKFLLEFIVGLVKWEDV